MIALIGFLAIALIAMLFARKTPLGALCHRQLVERPVERLHRLERKDLFYGLILLGVMLGGGEMALLLGPEFMAAYALDMAIYADAVLVSYAATMVAKLRGMKTALLAAMPRPFRGYRTRAKRRRSAAATSRKPANDDDGGPLYLAA